MAPKKKAQRRSEKSTSRSSSEPPSASSSSCKSTSTSLSASASTSASASASTPASTSASTTVSTSTSTTASTSTSTPASTSASRSSLASASIATWTPLSASLPASATLTEEIPIKLDGKNYLVWSVEVEGLLKKHSLLRFVVKPVIPQQYASESDRMQDIETEDYRRWFAEDQKLHTWLLSSLSESVVPFVEGCKHSWQIWDTVKKHFLSHLKAKVRQLRTQLKRVKKGKESVSEYVGKIQAIVDSLAEMGSPVSEKDHVDVVLAGIMSTEYREIRKLTRSFQGLVDVKVCNIETWMIILEEKFASEQRHVDGGGGPSTQDDAPSCSPHCSTSEGSGGGGRRKGHGRGGRRRGRN